MTAARDRIWLDSRTVGGARRAGEILEVLGTPDRPRYRVRWEDGRESIVSPSSDARVSLRRPREARAAARKPATARKRKQKASRPPAASGPQAAPGDRLVIRAHHLGEPPRDGQILETLGPDGRPPFRVRWEDTGAETLFFPGSDASVEHFQG
ncbi:MAG TPA: DUF1918 domain-containing protein [Gaiellaceae bacterium]|nr:DUF1918 domain-containing protein [Gaiellaceae bacterium]